MQSLFGFPRRAAQQRYKRVFNYAYAPRWADLTAWVDAAGPCYSDDAMTTIANVGDGVAAVEDLSQYHRHFLQASSTARPTLIVDSGFLALNFSASGNQHLLTGSAISGGTTMFSMMRAPSSGWSNYGVTMGRLTDSRPYLFANGGASFNDAPNSITRRNGLDVGNGGSLAPISVAPFLFVGDWKVPSTVDRLTLGQQSIGNWPNNMIIYETLLYSSLLPLGDIEDIEQMLMQKYGLS